MLLRDIFVFIYRCYLTKENDRQVPLYSIHANPSNSNEHCVGGRDQYIRLEIHLRHFFFFFLLLIQNDNHITRVELCMLLFYLNSSPELHYKRPEILQLKLNHEMQCGIGNISAVENNFLAIGPDN